MALRQHARLKKLIEHSAESRLYALGSGVVTSFGRNLRANSALAWHYLTFSNLFWIAVLILLTMVLLRSRSMLFRSAVRIGVIVILVFTCMNALRIGKRSARRAVELNAIQLEFPDRYPEIPEADLQLFFPYLERARRHLATMHTHELNVFRPKAER